LNISKEESMTAFTTEKIDVEPWFDMELFMGVSQETRLGGDVMDRFMTLWKNWLPHLTVKENTVQYWRA